MTYEDFIREQTPCWIEEIVEARLKGHIVRYVPDDPSTSLDIFHDWSQRAHYSGWECDRIFLVEGKIHYSWISFNEDEPYTPSSGPMFTIPRNTRWENSWTVSVKEAPDE